MIRSFATFFILLISTNCGIQGGAPHDPKLQLIDLARGNDTDGRLFTRYDPNGPSTWNQGWPWKLDLTGVSMDQNTTATAITPRHVVMADHYQRKTGGRVVFHTRKGRQIERHILKTLSFKQAGSSGDIAVGLLDHPLPASIRTYPVPAPRGDYNELLTGATALVTEQTRGLYFHQIAGINGSHVRFTFDSRINKSHQKNLVRGDSGNPSFLLTNGELALIETHTSGGPGSGPFYGAPEVVAKLREIIATLDPAYELKTVVIDARVLAEAAQNRAATPKPTPPPVIVRSPVSATTPGSTTPRQPRPRVVPPPAR